MDFGGLFTQRTARSERPLSISPPSCLLQIDLFSFFSFFCLQRGGEDAAAVQQQAAFVSV